MEPYAIALPVAPTAGPFSAKQHHVLVIDDGAGNGPRLCQQLQKLGARTSLICFTEHSDAAIAVNNPESADGLVRKVSLQDVTDSCIAELLDELQSGQGPITGFVHINPDYGDERTVSGYFDSFETRLIRCIYFIAKHLKTALRENSDVTRAFCVVVTRMDGKLGFSGTLPHSVIQGGYSGLLKSLKMEAPSLFCRNIDIAPEVSSQALIPLLMEELADLDTDRIEVGRTSATQRFALRDVEDRIPQQKNPQQPQAGTVFLVSGGGRGVTARCVEQLARNYQSKFIIVGRTPIDAMQPGWAESCATAAELRSAIVQQMRDAGEKVVPAKIDEQVNSLLTQRELRQSLETIHAAGGEAIYIAGDIGNAEDIKEQVDAAVKQLGTIRGIIHGAGNIADKLLESKQERDFDLVYNSKVNGLRTLLHCVDLPQLQYVVLFSSISGYYGQLGQTDYSLANEILNKFALMLARKQSLALLRSICWGPWDGGMVSPALKNVYEKFDVKVMPIDEGTRFFLDEFRYREPGTEQILICPKNIAKVRSTLSESNTLSQLDTSAKRSA